MGKNGDRLLLECLDAKKTSLSSFFSLIFLPISENYSSVISACLAM